MPSGRTRTRSALALPPLVLGARVVEARPTGPASAEIVWEWSVLDHLVQDFDPTKPNYGVVADRPERIDLNYALAEALCESQGNRSEFADWTHANTLDYNAELDQIMVTVRHFSEFWIIDRSATTEEAAGSSGGNAGKGGDLLYRWGNPRAYRAGTPADQRLFFPHAAHWIPEGSPGAGNVLIFNNGWEYPGFEREYSSVDEIALPSDGYNYRRDAGAVYGPSESVWTYAAEPVDSFYAPARSNAQRLPNGNTLIADGFANRNRIFEVTREGKVVWDFVYPIAAASAGIYRAYRYSPDYPGLRHLELDAAPTDLLNAAAGEPLARSAFDVYAADGYLVYAKEQCGHNDLAHLFYLHILPERADDPQEMRRRREYEEVDIGTSLNIDLHASLSNGKCAARIPLSDYPVAGVRTGQMRADESALWTAQLWMNPEPYRTAYRAARASEPAALATFDLYAADGYLVYAKEQCKQDDIARRFFLHIVPERTDDLPEERRQVGFDNLDFEFFLRGALFDGKCAASVPLPDYPVASIRTRQFSPDRELWSAEIGFPISGTGFTSPPTRE